MVETPKEKFKREYGSLGVKLNQEIPYTVQPKSLDGLVPDFIPSVTNPGQFNFGKSPAYVDFLDAMGAKNLNLLSATAIGVSTVPISGKTAAWQGASHSFNIEVGNTDGSFRIWTLSSANRTYLIQNLINPGITNNAADSIFRFTMNAFGTFYAGGILDWMAIATDGTEHQTTTGRTSFAISRVGTTAFVSNVTEIGGSTACTLGTLTGTWSITNSGGIQTVKFTPVSSLTTINITLYTAINILNYEVMNTFGL